MPEKEGAEEKTTKSVVNKRQKQMMGEEGYDIARDMGRVKPSKDKKEELDLTKVAESFGGDIVEVTRITGDNYKKFIKNIKKGSAPIGDIRNPDSAYDYNQLTGKEKEEFKKIKDEVNASKNKKPTKVTGDTTPKQGTVFGGQDDLKTKRASGGGRPRGSRTKIKTSPGQQKLDLGNVKGKKSPVRFKKGDTIRTDLRTVPNRKKSVKATPKQMASVQKDIKKRAQKKLATAVGKRKVRNVAIKQVAKKAATKAAVKGTAKAGGKFLAKRIPGVGGAISGAEAMGRLATGDYVGAALAGAEGIASFVPGVGTLASAGLGAIGAARDVRRATKAAKTVKKVLKYGRTTKNKVRTGKEFTQAFRKGRNVKKKMNPVNRLITPDKALGTSKGNKIKDAIVGKTPLGRFVRGASTTTGLGGLISTGLGAAKGAGDAVGHVGRRSAGSM